VEMMRKSMLGDLNLRYDYLNRRMADVVLW